MLTIHNLTSGYGKLTILHSVALTIATGQFIAILGPNGSGKSTLLKTIMGLSDRSAGEITFNGQTLTHIPTEEMQRYGIAYVPQRLNVFATLSVAENLQLAARSLKSGDSKHAQQAVFTLFPILKERQSQRAGKLSGGERQLLAIAIAWLARPKLMLLDEPSAGLSPLLVTEVFKTLKLLNQQGISLGVVEQNARSVLKFCDHAYVLREGQVAFQGDSAQLLANEELVKSYLGVHSGT